VAAILGAELLDQARKVELLLYVGLIRTRTHREPPVGRPRKLPNELTNEEAMRRLFPRRVVTRAKKEAAKAEEKATKRKDKGK
jgi:hypothetical protein